MLRSFRPALAAALILSTAACADFLGGDSETVEDPTLAAAFQSVPIGYSSAQTSYGEEAEGEGPFYPASVDGGMGPGRGRGRGGQFALGRGFGPLIGFGIRADFLGGRGFGWLFGRGRFGDPEFNGLANCAYDAVTMRVECRPVTGRRGLTIDRSIAFYDAAGNAQSAFDSVTTDEINTRVRIGGTITRRDSAETVVAHSSDRTVGGLADGSTERRFDGVASGREATTGTDSTGAFSLLRVAHDTISGIVIPKRETGPSYPTAGTIVRVMGVSRTRNGKTVALRRREVLTFDGSAVAKLVVTQGERTKTCSIPLPFGRPTCE
ncbi:MAG: hypothetical protein ACKVS7_17285 [Gemmatimonadaceae bacterium]